MEEYKTPLLPAHIKPQMRLPRLSWPRCVTCRRGGVRRFIVECQANKLSPRYYTVAMFYFLLGLTLSFDSFTVNKQLQSMGISIANSTSVAMLPMVPWAFKVFFGLISDTISFRGYHRKPYLLLSNFMCGITCILLALPDASPAQFIAQLTARHLFAAWCAVNIDTIMMQEGGASEGRRGKVNARMKIFESLGTTVGRISGIQAWASLGTSGVYALLAAFYFLAEVVSALFKDQRVEQRGGGGEVSTLATIPSIELNEHGDAVDRRHESIDKEEPSTMARCCFNIGLVREGLRHPLIRQMMLYNIMLSLYPSAGMAMFYFTQDVVMFTPGEMMFLTGMAEFGRLAGFFIYERFLTKTPLRKIYAVIAVGSLLLQVLPFLLVSPVDLSPGEACTPPNATIHANHTRADAGCYIYERAQINPVLIATSDDVVGEMLDEVRGLTFAVLVGTLVSSSMQGTIWALMTTIQNLVYFTNRVGSAAVTATLGIDHGRYRPITLFLALALVLDLASLSLLGLIPNMSVEEIRERTDAAVHLRDSLAAYTRYERVRGELLKNIEREYKSRFKVTPSTEVA